MALRYAVRVSGIEGFVLNKLDVLSGIHPVKIGVAYRAGDDTIQEFPTSVKTLEAAGIRPGGIVRIGATEWEWE